MSAELSVQMPTDTVTSLIAPYSGSVTQANTDLENETIFHLIKGNAATDLSSIINNSTTPTLLTDPSGSTTTFQARKFPNTEVAQVELLTKQGIHDGSFAISSFHQDISGIYVDASLNFGVVGFPVNKNFSVDPKSNSLFDSNIKMTFSDNNGPFADVSGGIYTNSSGIVVNGRFTATFATDTSGLSHFHKMLNSRYGNIENTDVLKVEENYAWNQAYSCAPAGFYNYYYTMNADGTRSQIPLDASLNIVTNGVNVNILDRSKLTSNHFGTYRLQQLSSIASTTLKDNSGNQLSSAYVSYYPLHSNDYQSINGDITAIPKDPISIDQFNSLFKQDTNGNYVDGDGTGYPIKPDYEFTIAIDPSNTKAGFTFDISGNGRTVNNNLVTMNDDALVDNVYLMKNWISTGSSCELSFINGTLSTSTGTNGITATNSLLSLSTDREVLESTNIANNGELTINPRNPTTRANETQSFFLNTVHPFVYYESDSSGIQPLNSIDNSSKTTQNVSYDAQIVFKSPANDLTSNFLNNNGAALNLINDTTHTLLNSNFSAANWEFLSANAPAVDNTVELFKIIPKNRLDDVDSFRDSQGNIVPNVFSNVTVKNFDYPLNQGEFNGRIDLNLKQATDFTFKNQLTASGWALVTDGLYCVPDSNIYNSDDSAAWPSQSTSELDNLVNGVTSSIPFKIEFNYNDYKNSIEISWGTGYSNSIIVPESLKTTLNATSSRTLTDVSGWSLTSAGTSRLGNSSNIELKRLEITNTFQIEFPLLLRPYNNVKVITPTYTIVTTSYIAYYKNSGQPIPSRFNSYFVNNLQQPVYTNIIETFDNKAKVAYGTLMPNDVKELFAKLTIDNGATTTVSNITPVSLFYGDPTSPTQNTITLLNQYDKDTNAIDITIGLQYAMFDQNGYINDLVLNDNAGYQIHLSNRAATTDSFDLFYWNSTPSNFSTKTTLTGANGNYLSQYNGYNGISSWTAGGTTYTIAVSFEDNGATSIANDTTILNVLNSTGTTIFTIKLKNGNYFSAPMFITRAATDIWRIKKDSGSDTFKAVNYLVESSYLYDTSYDSLGGARKCIALDNGVYLRKTTGTIDSSAFMMTAAYCDRIRFSLKPDLYEVNMVGSVSGTTNNISSLTHKYLSGTYSSKTLTIPYYRGYLGAADTNQQYIINRTKTTAEFRFVNGVNKYYQTVDVHCSNAITINNLSVVGGPTNTSGYNNLGLQFTFGASMLAAGEQSLYPIVTTGDNVTITIANPQATNYTLVTINKTLKDYELFRFLGTNYNNVPGSSVVINSSRLRFYSSAVETNAINNGQTNFTDRFIVKKYSLKLSERSFNIYKIPSLVGNPALRTDISGNLELDNGLVPTQWTSAYTGYSNAQMTAGITDWSSGAIELKRDINNTLGNVNSISFFTIHPPLLKFTGVSNTNPPASVPYSTATDPQFAANQLTYNMPVTDQGTYTPFAPTITIPRNDGYNQNIIVTRNPLNINNITFQDKKAPVPPILANARIYERYFSVPDNSSHSIIVLPQNTTMTLNSKLSTQTGTPSTILTTILNNEPITNIFNKPGITATYINNKTGISVAFTQDTTTPYVLSNSVIIGDISGNTQNIKFTIPALFPPNNSTAVLDLPTGTGTIVNMYTRNLIKDSSTGAYKIAVYKYSPFANLAIDWNNYENTIDNNYANMSSVTVKFTKRQEKIFNIPQRVMQDSTVQTLQDLINSIPYSTIQSASAWGNDVNYVDPATAPWFSFCSLTKNSLKQTLPKFFAPPNNDFTSSSLDGYKKMNIVTRSKILQLKDKLGNVVCELDHDSAFKTLLVSSSVLALAVTDNNTPPATYEDIIKRSVVDYPREKP